MSDFKYYGTFIDPANPDAVQCFLDTTYEPYKGYWEDFGATVKGMFGDETSIHGHWPWTRQLPGYFRGQYGYDLIPHLAALTDKTYPNAMRIRYQYFPVHPRAAADRYHNGAERVVREKRHPLCHRGALRAHVQPDVQPYPRRRPLPRQAGLPL
jgi:hypothetical protein